MPSRSRYPVRVEPSIRLITAAEFAAYNHCSPRTARRQLRASFGRGTKLFGAERWPLSLIKTAIERDLRLQNGIAD